MKITRMSPMTGKKNSMEIEVTQAQLDMWKGGVLIQDAMPNLTPDEREFIMTGTTAEDWDAMFPPEDEEE